jgi:hypothetical protein
MRSLTKAIILGMSSPSTNGGERRPPDRPTCRHTNLHEMSAFDFLQAHMHDLTTPDHPDTDDPTLQDSSPHDDLEPASDTPPPHPRCQILQE